LLTVVHYQIFLHYITLQQQPSDAVLVMFCVESFDKRETFEDSEAGRR